MTLVLGMDIGVTGAIALLQEDQLLEVMDLPVLQDGPKNRRTINAPILLLKLKELIDDSYIKYAFIEAVHARPGEGAVGAFSFGRSRGVVEGVFACFDLPIVWVSPARWKKVVGIPPGESKDASRSLAIKTWPGKASLFSRVKDHGRADAALIALAGVREVRRYE